MLRQLIGQAARAYFATGARAIICAIVWRAKSKEANSRANTVRPLAASFGSSGNQLAKGNCRKWAWAIGWGTRETPGTSRRTSKGHELKI